MPSVTRKTDAARAARAAARRDEILGRLRVAVEALAASSSFTAVSVAALIREAGVSRSTFYVYFEDKPDLLVALAEPVVDELLECARPWLALSAPVSRSGLERALEVFVDGYASRRVVFAALTEVAPYDERVSAFLSARMDQLRLEIAAHLAVGGRSGLDVDVAAGWTAALLERGLFRLGSADALADVLWNMLYREPA